MKNNMDFGLLIPILNRLQGGIGEATSGAEVL